MSVSMKSTKAQMYSEIERLRALVDYLQQSPPLPLTKPREESLPSKAKRYCVVFGVKSVERSTLLAWNG